MEQFIKPLPCYFKCTYFAEDCSKL